MSDYPEHDRLRAVTDARQTLGGFLEWLSEQGIVFAGWEWQKDCDAASGPFVGVFAEGGGQKWRCEGGRMVGHPESNMPGVIGSVCKTCSGTGKVERIEPRLAPTGHTVEQLLAWYFDIDPNKLEAEKRAMLAELNSRSAAQ